MTQILLLSVLLIAVGIYAVYFVRFDRAGLRSQYLEERIFIKRSSMVYRMAHSSITIDHLKSVQNYFQIYMQEPYQHSEPHQDMLSELVDTIARKEKSLLITNIIVHETFND